MKKKKKIYISGPITGTKDYMSRFSTAHLSLARQGYSVVNPAMVNAMLPEDTTYDEYMAMSFAMLDMCDSVYMLDGWQNSKGAKMEFERAVKNGLNIIYQTMPEWQQKIYNTFVASY
ncbi:MAG: DUF4406 domain-containing protein [Bacteroidales bacterium]|nr:DUF4406 domain-containing protein [Bacteroidales bacterium]